MAAPDAGRYYTLGVLSLNSDRYEEAAQAFRSCIQRAPNNLDGRYHLALTLSRDGRPEAARELLAPLVEQHLEFSMRPAAERLLASLGTP
jgi:thioredoxin-like negative regulator of GroEL